MSSEATFEAFAAELDRLVEKFGRNLAELKGSGYDEAKLRLEYLDPFFRALGWDLENRAALIQPEREVEIESATRIGGASKRADYLFRIQRRDRFVCEAKKPGGELSARAAFQAKRYAWGKSVPLALLTDFEELKVFVVGGRPYSDEPQAGEWKVWHFSQYPKIAREIWDLLSRDAVAADSIDKALDALPTRPVGKGKARQQYLLKPDRSRTVDADFLAYLEDVRRDLASDLWKNNEHSALLEGEQLTEACQRIIDRIIFLRFCEDRDIDTGTALLSIVDIWRKNTGHEEMGRQTHQQPLELRETPTPYGDAGGIRAPENSLWRAVVRHFRALDCRPPTHVPFFNGNLFKPHFTESLIVGDEWLANFISVLSDDESPYLFRYIPVEILGSVYERFLGKIVRPQGRGITIEEKPEVRKAGGVYYTPRYIVDYIVEQTVGQQLDAIAAQTIPVGDDVRSLKSNAPSQPAASDANLKTFAQRTSALRLLDPACGSGSFLLRAFERVCEHWQRRLTASQPPKERKAERAAWQKKHRHLCWVDEDKNNLHLTVALKRQILTQNIYGVDLDRAAVEVTQLSLYLKMLEDETRVTLRRQRELLSDEKEIALLPPLQDNIKCGNSLIACDFSVIPEDLIRVRAFDWPVQFPAVMRTGGFDAVIGNPPYGAALSDADRAYLQKSFGISLTDTAALFLLQKKRLLKSGGLGGYIVPKPLLYNSNWKEIREKIMDELLVACDCGKVWKEVKLEQIICIIKKDSTQPDYLSVTRQKETIRPLGKLKKKLCSEFDFILSNVSPQEIRLAQKMKSSGYYLGGILKNQRGAMLQDKVSSGAGFYAVLGGKQIGRFALSETPKGRLAKTAITDAKAFVKSNNVLVQNIVAHIENPIDHIQIIATVLPESLQDRFVILDTVNQLSVSQPFSSLFVAGLLNSKLINWFTYRFIFARAIRTMHFDAPVTDRIPFCSLDFSDSADKARHNKLVSLVDKMLALMPKLRTATLELERATLQNAVNATDRQINQLIYELYNLTPEEIALVENQSP